MKVELRGIHKLKVKGRTYLYAWRGGPRLRGWPGTPEFMASYNAAIEERRTPDTGKFKSLVTLYKASNDYKKLADSTRKAWSPWLDRIAYYFGELRIAQFDRPEKIRPIIRRWRNQWSDKPRTADYGCKFSRACFPMRLTHLERSRAIHARESNSSTVATAPKSFGPISILPL